MNFQSSLFQEVSIDTIRDIFEQALGEKKIWKAELLDGGMFNTTYFVEYGDSRKAVLRLGPVNRPLIMGFEENLMEAEKYVYTCCKKIEIPCSNILACDTSKQIVDRDFMIVEYIPSVVMVKAELTEKKEKQPVSANGTISRKTASGKWKWFWFLSRICAGKSFEKWSDALIYEVEDIAGRLVRLEGLSAADAEKIRLKFEENRELLDKIKIPQLLHTDLWEGNVLLDEETMEIAAIIDSDRAVFGDIDFEFASPWMQNPSLCEGYGGAMQETLTPDRIKRRELYQMFFCLLEAYVGYGEYNNLELYEERKRELLELMKVE